MKAYAHPLKRMYTRAHLILLLVGVIFYLIGDILVIELLFDLRRALAGLGFVSKLLYGLFFDLVLVSCHMRCIQATSYLSNLF